MKVLPDSLIRIANMESTRISLRADLSPSVARLTPRFGVAQRVALDSGGEFEFPRFDAPNTVKVEWIDEGENILCTSYAEIVSCHYFPLADLKNHGNGQDDFGALSDSVLFMARQAATEVFEMNARRSFVHRLGRTKDYGHGDFVFLADNDVYDLITSGYTLRSDCQVSRRTAVGPYPVWIEYRFGYDHVPAQVSRAVLELAAYILRPTNRPIGATGESTDAGYIHFTTAGRDGATDIPEVNATISQFGRGVSYLW